MSFNFFRDHLNTSSEEFFQTIKGKDYRLFEGQKDKWQDLCSFSHLDHLLNFNTFTTNNMKLFKDGKAVNESLICRKGSKTEVDKEKVYNLIREYGFSIKLVNVSQFSSELSDFKKKLAEFFKTRITLNLYFTPQEGGSCFIPHQDAYDIFILQVEGEKKWNIASETQYFYLNHIEKNESLATNEGFALKKGEALYLPAKIVHQASCSKGNTQPSIHLTIGLHELTYQDFLKFLINEPKANLLLQKGMQYTKNGIDKEEIQKVLDIIINGYLRGEKLHEMIDKFYKTEIIEENLLKAPFCFEKEYLVDEM